MEASAKSICVPSQPKYGYIQHSIMSPKNINALDTLTVRYNY